jgi:hypothetical protein
MRSILPPSFLRASGCGDAFIVLIVFVVVHRVRRAHRGDGLAESIAAQRRCLVTHDEGKSDRLSAVLR